MHWIVRRHILKGSIFAKLLYWNNIPTVCYSLLGPNHYLLSYISTLKDLCSLWINVAIPIGTPGPREQQIPIVTPRVGISAYPRCLSHSHQLKPAGIPTNSTKQHSRAQLARAAREPHDRVSGADLAHTHALIFSPSASRFPIKIAGLAGGANKREMIYAFRRHSPALFALTSSLPSFSAPNPPCAHAL